MKRLNRRSFLATVAGGALAGGFLAACTREGGEDESDAAPATNRGRGEREDEEGGGSDSDAS